MAVATSVVTKEAVRSRRGDGFRIDRAEFERACAQYFELSVEELRDCELGSAVTFEEAAEVKRFVVEVLSHGDPSRGVLTCPRPFTAGDVVTEVCSRGEYEPAGLLVGLAVPGRPGVCVAAKAQDTGQFVAPRGRGLGGLRSLAGEIVDALNRLVADARALSPLCGDQTPVKGGWASGRS